MQYIIKELEDTTTDNYLKDTIDCKGIDINEKIRMIKTHMTDALESKLELERLLDNTKSVMIEVNTNDNEFKLLIDNGISIVVYSLKDLGSLIKKLNKKVDYEEIIQYIIHSLNCNYSELDIKLVECLNSNTSNEKLKKITGLWLDGVRKEEMLKEKHMANVKRLGKHIIDALDDVEIAKVMNDTFMNSDDMDLRVLAGEFIFNNVLGKDLNSLDDSAKEIDNILYNDLKPIKEVIREHINSYVSVGSSYIKTNGDIKEDTKKMFDYVMDCDNIYDKAYVMQSVLDRVLSIYFDTLKKIDKEN